MPFDPQAFLTANTSASTQRLLIPIDHTNTFAGYVSDAEAKSGTSQKSGRPWARLDLKISIQDPAVLKALSVSEVIRTFGIMLDLDDDGEFDTRKGRNVTIGLLAKAFGLNPDSFNPAGFVGRPCKVVIAHEPGQNGEARDVVKTLLPA